MSWIEDPGESALDLHKLQVDEAYLNITTDAPFHLYSLVDDCYRCPFSYLRFINESQTTVVSTVYGTSWRLYSTNVGPVAHDSSAESFLCEVRPRNFGEFGIYDLIRENDTCKISTQKPPVNIYYPLLLIICGLIIATLISSVISYFITKWQRTRSPDNSEVHKKPRITALDCFRGICIMLMIFVNDGGGRYTFFEHATWNGLQFADLLFPWFMWIMGVCIPISVRSQLKKKATRSQILWGIIKRAFMLFLLGLALNTTYVGADLKHLRIFGVLQRFAVAYLVSASLVLFLMLDIYNSDKRGVKSPVGDIANLILIWVLMLGLIAGHCYLTFYFPTPGCPTGYLGPGGLHYNGLYQNCTGGVAGYIDRLLLTENHLYQHPTSFYVYKSQSFDPEGIFGCILSIFHVFLGVQAGSTALNYTEHKARIKRWLIWGSFLGVLGCILCQGRQEGGWIPVNKNLWSLSFVLVTSSLAFFMTSFLHFVIDVQKLWRGVPFIYPGMNAITLYVGHSICYELFPFHWRYGAMNTHFILTLEALWGSFVWTFVAYMMHRNDFFLSL